MEWVVFQKSGNFEAKHKIRRGDIAAAVERMAGREVHPEAPILHRGLKEFGEFHQ